MRRERAEAAVVGARTGSDWSAQRRLEHRGWTVTANDCWEWNGTRDNHGYGTLGVRKRQTKAHRLAYETWVAPIPDGSVIRHRCDNPPCINPQHLEPGTHAQNMADMVARNRVSRGETSGLNKLMTPDVLAIREARATGETQKSIADRYGLDPSTVSLIVRRKLWAHVA